MDNRLRELETVFKALADATRLRILALLTTGEVCVCNVHDTLRISQPKASRHLAYLRKAGLVDTRRDGLWIHYRLARRSDQVRAAVESAVHQLLTHSSEVRKDLERLQKATGCVAPTVSAPLVLHTSRPPARP